MAFIRQHMMAGDPMGGLALPTRRKGAGIGTKAKAARHRAVRFRRIARGGDPFLGLSGKAATATKPLGPQGFNPAQFFANMAKAGKSVLGKVAGVAGPALSSGFFGPAGALAGGLIGAAAPKTRAAAVGPGFLPGSPMEFGGLPAAPSFGGGGGGGGRRRINPANVKALRRGLSRVRSFTRLVKSVNKLLPPAARHKTASFPKRKRR